LKIHRPLPLQDFVRLQQREAAAPPPFLSGFIAAP